MVFGLASFGKNALLGIFEVSSEKVDLLVHFRIIGEHALISFSLLIQIFINWVLHRLRGLICRPIVMVCLIVLWRHHYVFERGSRLHFSFLLSRRLGFNSHILGQAYLFLNTLRRS